MQNRHKSRRRTPWDGCTELSPSQEFLKMHFLARYEGRHPTISETEEAKKAGEEVIAASKKLTFESQNHE